jgi:hypothetical protein
VLDKIVMHTYAALIGELLYMAINTVPQLRYSMSSLTRYVSKATPVHLAYAEAVLRYLIGVTGRQLTWCGSWVSCLMYSVKFWHLSISAGLMTKTTGEALRLHTLSQIIALSTAEAELMALASCCCEIVWARQLAINLDFPYSNPRMFTKI